MMEQIQPIKDSHRYREWVTFAESNVPAFKKDRGAAIMLLAHPEPRCRMAAVESFLSQWHLDYPVLEKIFAMSCTAPDPAARYFAAGSICLYYLRCKVPDDKLMLQKMLDRLLAIPGQVPEIVEDLGYYTSCKTGRPSREVAVRD